MKQFFYYANLMLLLLLIGLPLAQAQTWPPTLGTTSTINDPAPAGSLERFGPIDPGNGFPMWYEDKNGLKLGACTDLALCFFEIPNPALPLSFPSNYPDEIFFFAAESLMIGSPDSGVRAIVGMATEGAFFNGAVVDGEQVVFSRVRIRIDNLIAGETYRVTYPYGVHSFIAEADAGAGTAAGPGLSLVRDIGLAGLLDFNGPLNGDIGPFLTATSYTGTEAFISNTLNGTTVTGSPNGTNFFRIEGPGVALPYANGSPATGTFQCTDPGLGPDPVATDDCIQSNLFSIQGQKATRFGAQPTRAILSKETVEETPGLFVDKTYVNIWAQSSEAQNLLASVDGNAPVTLTEGSLGNYFLRIEVPNNPINPSTVMAINASDSPPNGNSIDITEAVNITSATYTMGSGLTVTTQSSNQVDPAGGTAFLVTERDSTRSITLVDGGSGVTSGSYVLPAGTPDNPPIKVVVAAGGAQVESDVIILGAPNGGAPVSLVAANAGPDQNVIGNVGVGNTTTVNLNGSDSLGPIGMTYAWIHDAGTAISLVGANDAAATFETPSAAIPGGILTVNFTLTVSDGITTSSDVVTVSITQPSELPVDSCNITRADYRDGKEKWVVEGNCVVLDNQLIEVYLGNDAGPLALIGTGNVDALGLWAVKPGNGSATTIDGTIPIPGVHTRVWAESLRGGGLVWSSFIID